MQRLLLLLTLCALSLAQPGFAQPLPASYAHVQADAVVEAELLRQTNRARADNGVGALRQDEGLALAARQHALEMARLNYFSHQSPTPSTRTTSQRVAKAGSPLMTVGENIAKVGNTDVAVVTTQGWMDSPGHRANLLNPAFTHVGFGTARDRGGQTLVVQVLAYAPVSLQSANVEAQTRSYYDITLDVSLPEAKEAIFTYGDENSDLLALAAGRQQVRLQTQAAGQIHIRGAVRAPTGGGFILEDGGWLTLATGRYRADTDAPKRDLQILGATATPGSGYSYEVTLQVANPGGLELAVFVGEVYEPGARTGPGMFRLSIPTTMQEPEIALGQILDGNRVEILMVFSVDTTYGTPRLTARQF